MAETMQLDRLMADPTRVRITTPAYLRYKDKLGPIVGVSLHLGNWELAIWPLTMAGANPAGVYRSVNNPYVDQYLRDQRKELFPGGLFGRGKVEGEHGDNQRTARAIQDFVRRGGRLGLICDLYDRTGLPMPFFGREAGTQAIAAMIARRVGAADVDVALPAGRHARAVSRSKSRSCGCRARPIRARTCAGSMAEMQRQFEAWIRETPEQWMWSNRRWS